MNATLLLFTVVINYLFSNLKTLNTISAEKNSTIVFPLPIDMMTFFMKKSAWKPTTAVENMSVVKSVVNLIETINEKNAIQINDR